MNTPAAEVRNAATRNRLLSKVAPEERERLLADAKIATLPLHTRLITPNESIKTIYFPVSGLASLVTILEDGSTVESGSVGREGMVGIPVVLNAMTTPMQTVVQIAGDFLLVPSATVKALFDEGRSVSDLLQRYIHTLFVVASQSAACNRRHHIEARLSRWLLMSSDGIGSDHVAITHEYLAVMLGVRRSSVTDTALKLQEQKLIEYKRAGVTIVDRPGLETVACECYTAVRAEFDRLLA